MVIKKIINVINLMGYYRNLGRNIYRSYNLVKKTCLNSLLLELLTNGGL